MPEVEVKIGVVNMKALAERARSSQRAKMRELEEELLVIRDQLEKEIEGGFRYGFWTVDQISAGWHEFYRIEGRIEESKLIIREYSQLLELSSYFLRLEQTQDISQPSLAPERGAGVAKCESQLVIQVLETESESTAQQQSQQQQQFC